MNKKVHGIDYLHFFKSHCITNTRKFISYLFGIQYNIILYNQSVYIMHSAQVDIGVVSLQVCIIMLALKSIQFFASVSKAQLKWQIKYSSKYNMPSYTCVSNI